MHTRYGIEYDEYKRLYDSMWQRMEKEDFAGMTETPIREIPIFINACMFVLFAVRCDKKENLRRQVKDILRIRLCSMGREELISALKVFYCGYSNCDDSRKVFVEIADQKFADALIACSQSKKPHVCTQAAWTLHELLQNVNQIDDLDVEFIQTTGFHGQDGEEQMAEIDLSEAIEPLFMKLLEFQTVSNDDHYARAVFSILLIGLMRSYEEARGKLAEKFSDPKQFGVALQRIIARDQQEGVPVFFTFQTIVHGFKPVFRELFGKKLPEVMTLIESRI